MRTCKKCGAVNSPPFKLEDRGGGVEIRFSDFPLGFGGVGGGEEIRGNQGGKLEENPTRSLIDLIDNNKYNVRDIYRERERERERDLLFVLLLLFDVTALLTSDCRGEWPEFGTCHEGRHWVFIYSR